MSDDDEKVTDSDQEWSHKDRWEEESERGTEGEVLDSCELAPHSAMSAGAGRIDSPSPQDIRLLHDLVEDLAKEQEEKIRPRAEQLDCNADYGHALILSHDLLRLNESIGCQVGHSDSVGYTVDALIDSGRWWELEVAARYIALYELQGNTYVTYVFRV
ncbi:hypothetical protein WN48_05858 [Eufriesea mexicana]|uniref:Uncharacterized protein n=1 Tax=Eufriesea mexicana TaxID=516756 RepID=A0A310SMH7_9HYME|nr:hypothetical protein WN48_05858 [Eufriesea mexicana]